MIPLAAFVISFRLKRLQTLDYFRRRVVSSVFSSSSGF